MYLIWRAIIYEYGFFRGIDFMSRYLAVLFMVFSVCGFAAEVYEYKLENGMKVLVKVDKRAPVATSQVWYRVGSSYEHNGITGISHMLEHMMFKGTKKYKSGEARQIISDNGGEENAFTSRDYTAYYQTIASDRLHICFELEAERMQNLLFDEKEFASEHQVVAEERRLRTDDSPVSTTYERFFAAAYSSNPYRTPVIGWAHDIETYNTKKLKQWYRNWYAPNNATLIVIGDVNPDAVYSLAKKHFGAIKAKKLPEIAISKEITPLGKKEIEVIQPNARVPMLVIGYNTPSAVTAQEKWEPYALEVMGVILGGSDSSRIISDLVRQRQIVSGAWAGYSMTSRLNTLFMLGASPALNVKIETVREELFRKIDELKTTSVTEAELMRVKTQIKTAGIYKKDSISAQAYELGQLESIGLGWQFERDYYDNIEKVTAEQIMAVAKKYLTEKRMTIATLLPEQKELPEQNRPTADKGEENE